MIKLLLIFPALKSIYNKYKYKKEQELLRKRNERRDFKTFREHYISKSQLVYNSLKELQEEPPQADCYITGSDQVWAQLLSNPENAVFFLDFGTKRVLRISYAASFAMPNYPFELKEKLKSQLQKFQLVTVREKSGVEICKNLGIEAFQIIDPTLLLDKKQYMQLITKKIKTTLIDYIYIYSLNISSPEEIRWNELFHYSVKNGLDIKATPSSGYITGYELFGPNITYEYATISQWIANIYNSQLFITPSFHGIVFAIILNKKFIYVPLKGKYSAGNCRVFDLLEDLELTNFILEDGKDIESYVNQKINWNKVSAKLSELKRKSSTLLSQYLSYENSL